MQPTQTSFLFSLLLRLSFYLPASFLVQYDMGTNGDGSPKPNPSRNWGCDSSSWSEMEIGSRRLEEMELDAARALTEMATIEGDGGGGGGASSRKRIGRGSQGRGSGESSRDFGVSRSEVVISSFTIIGLFVF